MEFWSIIMDMAYASGNIKPMKRNDNMVSYLLFADDMLVFCKGMENQLKELMTLYRNLNSTRDWPLTCRRVRSSLTKDAKSEIKLLVS